jgi:8-oxo-dGTP pyrophosphatase MutT (NUDIX family)|tara:strand:+ start:1862 stop:2596 length:735 start_codon:yes stop_codon:yes gene_type:complete
MSKHKNDIYGDLEKDRENEGSEPAIPAATVLLLREHQNQNQVLMLHKTSKIAFGGMWVFPGGKIDAADYDEERNDNAAARVAAARETEEEAGISIPANKFIWFAHWTPPASTARRFATWFFLSSTDGDHEITVDGGEIQNHQWISPLEALEQHAKGEIDLAPPTWVSLYHLSKFDNIDQAIKRFTGQPPRYYQTRVVKDNDGSRVALWDGDAGYPEWDAGTSGARHRLTMSKAGFKFEHDAVYY